jgi:mono/diheme cytochrome c family protein
MKKLGILLVIALPLAYAISGGKARAQTFPGLPATYVAKLAFGSQASKTTNESLVAQGRARFVSYKCGECHGENGEGGGDGPDLTTTLLDADQISKFLEKPSPDAYMKGMPDIPASNPDNQALVAYILSLKRPKNPK